MELSTNTYKPQNNNTMDIQSLMIGDLVYACVYGQKHIAKVVGFLHDAIRVLTKDGEASVSSTFIEPIPLTEEILIAKGFEFGLLEEERNAPVTHPVCEGVPCEFPKRWVFEDEEQSVCITFPKYPDGGEILVVNTNGRCVSMCFDEIIYVHELQRILRCCGSFGLVQGMNEKEDYIIHRRGT